MQQRCLVRKHKGKPVFIDTNLLVLYLVGLVNPKRIESFKRTSAYLKEDFELLQAVISNFSQIVSTAHVLAELSNLAELEGKEQTRIREEFRRLVTMIEEQHDPSRTLVSHPLFARLGLTDAAIATVGERGILVITADLDLHVALEQRGAEAINFNHVRALAF